MAYTATDIAKLYIAMFDRAPEKEGLDYWLNQANSGMSLSEVANAMADAAKQFPDSYPQYANYDPTNPNSVESVINEVYKILFNKDSSTDPDGVNYWVNEITSGKMDLGTAVVTLEKAAEEYLNSDDAAAKAAAETFVNRADAAVQIADVLPTADINGDGKVDSTDFQVFKDTINIVTDDSSTIDKAVQEAEDYAPKSFDLTTGVDNIVGTDGANTFNASLLTLNDGDSIDGKGGIDTLKAEINSDIKNVTTNSVEDIQFTTYGNHVVNMSKMSGVQTVETVDSTGTLSLSNVNAKTGLGIKGLNQTLNASYTGLSGTNDVLNLKLDNASNASVSVSSGFEKMNVNVNGTNSIKSFNHMPTDITMSGNGSINFKNNITVKNLNVASDVAFSVGKDTNADGFNDSATLLSSATDNTTVILGDKADNIQFKDQAPANKTVTLNMGGGDDYLTFTKGSATDVIDLGSGDDNMILQGSALTSSDLVKGGDGNDTLTINNTGNNSMVLMGVENLVLNSTATGSNVINFADTPLNVTMKANNNAFSLTGLSQDSTVKVVNAKNATAGVKGLTIGYMKPQDNATITIDTKATLTKAISLKNIDNATIKANQSLKGAQNISLNAVKTLALNVAKSVNVGNITDTASTDTLKNVKITGTTVTAGNITSTALASVKAEATDAKLSVGTLKNTKGNITAVSLKASKTVASGNISAKTIGTINITSTNNNVNLAAKKINATNTISKVEINAKTTAAVKTIKSTSKNIDNVKIVSTTSKTAKVTNISATKGKIGNVTINSVSKATVTGKIAAKTLSSINISSSKGAVTVATIGGTNNGKFIATNITKVDLKGVTKAKANTINAKTINTVNLSSSAGNVSLGKITAANTLTSLNINAKTTAAVTTIKSTSKNIDNVKIVASSKTASVSKISVTNGKLSNVTIKGASAKVTKSINAKTIGTINLTATSTNGSVNVNKIAATATLSKVNIASKAGAKVTTSIAAKNLGDVKIVGNGNLTIAKIATTGKDDDGFNVTLKAGAKGQVAAGANNTAAVISNKTGNINNVLITGKSATVSIKSGNNGYVKNVNLNGVLSGAKVTISNNETSALTDSKTVVSLGGNSTKVANTLTFKGSVDAVNVYGGKAKDTINLGSANTAITKAVNATLVLGDGADKVVDYTQNTKSALNVNLGSDTKTDTVVMGAAFSHADTVKDFTSGTDKIKLDLKGNTKATKYTKNTVNKAVLGTTGGSKHNLATSKLVVFTTKGGFVSKAILNLTSGNASAVTAKFFANVKSVKTKPVSNKLAVVTTGGSTKKIAAGAASSQGILIVYDTDDHKLQLVEVDAGANSKVTKVSIHTVATITLSSGSKLTASDIAIF